MSDVNNAIQQGTVLLEAGTPMICLKCACSGDDPNKDKIIAFSAVKVAKTGTYSEVIASIDVRFKKRDIHTDPSVYSMFHFSRSEEDAVSLIEGSKMIADFLGKRPLICCYAAQKDLAFLSQLYRTQLYSRFEPLLIVDVKECAREKMACAKLTSICKILHIDSGLDLKNAMHVAIATFRVFSKIAPEI